MKRINIALLGFGTVGYGVYRVLGENNLDIQHREGLDIRIKRVLVRSVTNSSNVEKAPRELYCTAMEDILNDADISMVVECMGGVEPARTYILAALNKGKSVVTSNKEVVSKHWHAFDEAAKRNGVGFYIESTVGGGIPLLRTVMDGLSANKIQRVMGIINGTTNFILTKMSEKGLAFDDVLQEAQARGYAEADPSADVEGFDANYKLSILSSMAFHTHIPVDAIHREGITKLTTADFDAAKKLGYEIKLLAIGKKVEGDRMEVEARIHPTMIPKTHPLASIRGTYNAIYLTGNAVGDVMLYGRGAGQMPTASAVVSDIIYASLHEGRHRYTTFRNIPDMDVGTVSMNDWESIYCIRLRVADRPGVLAGIAGVFAEHDVSLKSVLQLADPIEGDDMQIAWITFVTHRARELAVQAALHQLEGMDDIECVESIIRVEE